MCVTYTRFHMYIANCEHVHNNTIHNVHAGRSHIIILWSFFSLSRSLSFSPAAAATSLRRTTYTSHIHYCIRIRSATTTQPHHILHHSCSQTLSGRAFIRISQTRPRAGGYVCFNHVNTCNTYTHTRRTYIIYPLR